MTRRKLRKPPMVLDLDYLITPLLKAPRDQQIVRRKVIQILYAVQLMSSLCIL